MRQIEFIADEEGDWAFHCHKSHHTMNAMGHDTPTLIGIDQSDIAGKIANLIPDYMAMGSGGMADMTEMPMPLPENTLPMMTGVGPFGGVDMGGMFSVLKVRKNQKPGDYKDPGWYKHPAGTVAREWTGNLPLPARSANVGIKEENQSMPMKHQHHHEIEVQVRKPVGKMGH
jgi:hypothetical protein